MPKWSETPESRRGNEARKVRWRVLRYLTGLGFDLGCGGNKIHTNAFGVDNVPGTQDRPSEASITGSLETLPLFADGAADYVFSSFALHRLARWKEALREWWRVLKPGGRLVLYLPHPDLYDDPGEPEPIPSSALVDAMYGAPGGWTLLVNETREQGDEYGILLVFEKRKDRKRVRADQLPAPEKRVAVLRYGGVGDHIMMSSVTERLHRDGYAVTYVTDATGAAVVKHDPNIAEVWTESASLAPEQLAAYSGWLEGNFDRFVQGMNTVENALVPQPSAPQYRWPVAARRALWGSASYLEMQHLLCQVPMDLPPRTAFYPSVTEAKWAKEERTRVLKEAKATGPLVLWALAGSSIHKVSPYTPDAVALFLAACPNAVVVTTGDKKAEQLYGDFGENPRHVKRAGVWSLREALTFAVTSADAVAGPDTGVLNAVGVMDVPKAVWLGHTTPANLVKQWRNVVTVLPDPKVAPCSPCHRLHFGWDSCHRAPSGAALCVEGTPAKAMADAVLAQLEVAA